MTARDAADLLERLAANFRDLATENEPDPVVRLRDLIDTFETVADELRAA